jgi:Zn finger protein HypA/HybF involved in hydrogenase expression
VSDPAAAGNGPAEPAHPATLEFVCKACGAQTAYAPGTTTLRCSKCGALQDIAPSDKVIVEHSYDDWAAVPEKRVAQIGKQVLQCQNCGATTETDLLADTCHFCHGVLVSVQNPPGLIAPEAVVPFALDNAGAVAAFRTWVKSRHFAPNALKRVGRTDSIKGTYVPHWTYDARTDTAYTGQRGEYYYTTETYTVSDGRGGTRTETRQVQHTAWYPAAGDVSRAFDDVLVPASHTLPAERLEKMGPWQLGDARPYQPDYLAGYAALRYDVDPDTGLAVARSEMESVIRADCEHDIGGDVQRVQSMDVRYSATMFKLVLLPLWIATYLYGARTFQVLVNANTGEVVGQRPYSRVKIAFAVVVALAVIAAIILAVTLH